MAGVSSFSYVRTDYLPSYVQCAGHKLVISDGIPTKETKFCF